MRMTEAYEKGMTIWLIQQHSMPPELGHYNRQNNFGKYLKRDGYRPIAFAGSKLHNSDVQMITDGSKYRMYTKSDCPFCFIRTCDYGESKKKRIIADFQFHWRLYRIRKKFPKPDLVLGSSSYMLSACLAIIFARKFKCRSIVEVRDLWPQAIVDYLGFSPKNPIIKILYQVEKWMYTNADELVFTMEGAKDYIIEHGLDKAHGGTVDLKKAHHINNGVDLEKFIEARDQNHFYDEDLADPDKLCIVYTGSVRKVNRLEYMLDIAKYFAGTNVYFLIWGQGNERERLEKKAREEGIVNIKFKGHAEKNKIPSILSQADFLFLHFEYKPLVKYGYSPNKLFDYFAAQKPIISDVDCKYELVRSNQVGIVVPNDDAEMASRFIKEMIENKENLELYKRNIAEVVKQYDFANLTKKLESLIASDS